MSNSTWSNHIEQWVLFLNQLIADTEDDGLRIKSERQLKTIECVRYSAVLNPKLISEFITPSNVVPAVSDISDYFLELNESQKAAVNIAVGDNVLSLIQGPPGTGKTQVIAEICLQLYKQNPNIRILVCSETHIAVNNLISRISSHNDNIRFIRIRDKEQDILVDEYTPHSIIDSYLEWLNGYCHDKETIDIITQSFSNTDDVSLEKSLALSSNITGMTCNRVGAYEFESSHEMFDVVIIDEVCKATLPEILMPLTVAKKAILVGDPKQLPPIFCSEEIDIIRHIEQCDLQNYMFVDKLFSLSTNM